MLLSKIKRVIKAYELSEIISICDRRYGLGALEELLATNWFNPFATIWINFRCLSFKQAIILPIWVYGRPRFYSLSGKITIDGNVSSGMIRFNQIRSSSPCLQNLQSELKLWGSIIFRGGGIIGTGTKIFVEKNAVLRIGREFKIADMVNIGCLESISIGDMTRITHRCQIMDSNYHYIANFNKKIVPKITHPIVIGSGCWIGNTTTVTGAANIPEYTIVASNSLVNKSSNKVPPNSIVGGIPAKLISSGFRRVENLDLERLINQFYSLHPDDMYELCENMTMADCSRLN